jgi:mono/diheme cytochrome c family protein
MRLLSTDEKLNLMDHDNQRMAPTPASSTIKTLIGSIFGILLLSACSFSLAEDITPPPGAEVPFEQPTQPPLSGPLYPIVDPDPSAGRSIYNEKCAPCHGESGLGDGAMAGQLPVPAPALGTDVIARQSSPAAWYMMVTQGNLERRMPPFSSLTDRQRWDVVAYAYSLSNPAQRILAGKTLYEDNCAACHGEIGDGAGPEAAALSVPATDFTDQEMMAGISGEQLFQRISEGVGTDMPAFAEQLSEEERWILASYLRSLTFAPRVAVSDAPETPTIAATEESAEVQASPTIENVSGFGRVEGQVVSISGGEIPTDLTVTLYGFDQMEQTFTAEAQIDNEGQYSFEEVPLPQGRAFLASTEYEGVAYNSDIVVVDPENSNIALIIPYYETTTDTSSLSVDRLHLLFEYVDPDILRVVEMYIISNSSDQIVVAPEEGQPVLSYSVPEEAINLQFQDGVIGERYIELAEGFGDFAAVRPGAGQHQVIYSYDLPYKNKFDFNQTLDLPVNAVIVLLPEDGIKIKGEHLMEMGTRDVQGSAFQMYTSDLVPAGTDLAIDISGRPRTGGAGLVLGSNTNLVIGAFAFGLALVLAGGWLYLRNRNGKAAEARQEIEEQLFAGGEDEDVDMLLDAILALDDQYKSGQLPEEAYLKRRAELKAQIKEKMGS